MTPAAVAVLIHDVGEDETGRLLGAGAAQIICKPIAAPALAAKLHAGLTARAGDSDIAKTVSVR